MGDETFTRTSQRMVRFTKSVTSQKVIMAAEEISEFMAHVAMKEGTLATPHHPMAKFTEVTRMRRSTNH